jgi:hypothetical protein
LAWFGTTHSKSSRLNFLDLLRANYTDYVVNDAALRYMSARSGRSSLAWQRVRHPHRPACSPAAGAFADLAPRQGDPLWMARGIARSTPGFCIRRPVEDVAEYFIARVDVLLSTRQIAIR